MSFGSLSSQQMSTTFAWSRFSNRFTAYPAHLWRRYNTALQQRPLRTRMISSGVLYIIGDHVAQLGIEDRRWFGSWRNIWAGGQDGKGVDAKDGGEEEMFDWARLVRMSVCECYDHLPFARGVRCGRSSGPVGPAGYAG